MTPPRLEWTSYHVDTSEAVSSHRSDVAIVPLEEQEEGADEVEWGDVVENGENPSLKDGTIRLTGGRDDAEGNVEVKHVWDFNRKESPNFLDLPPGRVGRHLRRRVGPGRGQGGLPDARLPRGHCGNARIKVEIPGNHLLKHFSRYGYTPTTIWMDNLYCYGTEDRLDVRPLSSFVSGTLIVDLVSGLQI